MFIVIGNSTSWITNIQGAKYKIQVIQIRHARGRERGKQTEREIERDREREKRVTERETERERKKGDREREKERERERERGKRDIEGERVYVFIVIGNSTSWITNIQGAKYKIQVIQIRHVSCITYKCNKQQPCPSTQYT